MSDQPAPKAAFKRVMLKISGEALMGDQGSVCTPNRRAHRQRGEKRSRHGRGNLHGDRWR